MRGPNHHRCRKSNFVILKDQTFHQWDTVAIFKMSLIFQNPKAMEARLGPIKKNLGIRYNEFKKSVITNLICFNCFGFFNSL